MSDQSFNDLTAVVAQLFPHPPIAQVINRWTTHMEEYRNIFQDDAVIESNVWGWRVILKDKESRPNEHICPEGLSTLDDAFLWCSKFGFTPKVFDSQCPDPL